VNLLRRIAYALRPGWYDNVDWADDFDPSEPRVPKGQPGGGQWTAGGGMAAPASPNLTKYAGPVGAKFKKLVDAHFHELTNSTATPEQIKAKVSQLSEEMKSEAGKFKSSNVAGYINQLIHHLEVTHGYPEGSLGKAVKLKGDPGLALVPPSDDEIQKMAVAAGAPDIPAEPEPETPAFVPGNPSTTQGQEAIGKIGEIAANKWSPEEKIAWINALAVDIPEHDAGALAQVQAEIAKLGAPAETPAASPMPKVPASWAAPGPTTPTQSQPVPPGELDPPTLKTQSKIYDIFHGLGSYSGLPTESKILAIESILQNATHPPNVAYAEQAIALLKGTQAQAAPPASSGPPKEDEPTGPEPQTDIQKAIVAAAQTPGNSSAKFWAMQKVVEEAGLAPDDASLKFAQQWANTLYGGAGSTLEPSSKGWSLMGTNQGAPEPAPAGATMTPEEEVALLNKLPKPNPFKPTTQGQMWQIASDPSLTAEGKIAQIEQMKAGYALSDDQEYADKTIAALKGGTPAAAASSPGLGDLDKVLTAEEQKALEQSLPIPGGTQAEQDLWETAAMKNWTAASKIKQLEADMTQGGIAEAGTSPQSLQKHLYAQSLIDFLKGSPYLAPSPAADPNAKQQPPAKLTGKPLPLPPTAGSGVQGNMLKKVEAATTQAEKEAILAHYLHGGFSPETEGYAKTLLAAVQANGVDPTAIPDIPPDLQGPGSAAAYNFHQMATSGLNTAAQLQDYVDSNFVPGGDTHTCAETVIAAKKAQEGGGAPATAPADYTIPDVPGSLKGFGTIHNIVGMATGGMTSAAALEDYLGKAGALPADAVDFANHVIGIVKAKEAGTQPPAAPVSTTLPKPDPNIAGTTFPQDAYDVATKTPGSITDKLLALAKWNSAAIKAGSYFENSPVGVYVKSLINAMGSDPAALTPAASPTSTPNVPMYGGSSTGSQGQIYKAATDPNKTNEEKITAVMGFVLGQPDNLKYQSEVLAALGAGPGTSGASAPAIPAPTNSASVQQSIHGFANDPNLTPAQKISKIVAFPIFGPSNVKYKVSLLQALGAPMSDIIPKTPNGPTTLQGKVYKAATQPNASFAVKIANVKALTLSTKPGQKYQNAVIAALEALQSGPATPAAPPPPKKPPEPPPANLTPPDAGSNTQNSMWAVANKQPTAPAPLNNEEKIAEITKILANSSGAAGGKAETYANKLITALGGAATTKTAAVAANAPTPITPTPYGGGGSVGTPTQPKKNLSFSSEVDPAKYPSWIKAAPTPTPEEKDAVHDYTNGYYTPMNDALRSGDVLSGQTLTRVKNLATWLERAQFPEDAVLTRKVSGTYANKILAKLSKGAMFIDHGFASSDHWSGDLTIKIHIKKGQKAAYVRHLSANKPEQEVVIQKGSVFRILDYDASQKHVTVEIVDKGDPDYPV
jgi:hypothetical protein